MGICNSVCSSCSDSKNTGGHSNNSHRPSHNQHGGQSNNNSHRGGGSKCYTCNAHINQRPEVGRDDYRIQINAQHHGDHTCDEQILTMIFNHPATFISCSNGNLNSNNNTTRIRIKLTYHNNPNDNIEIADFKIKCAYNDLEVVSCSITDNH